ncbi:MAG: hypothetical protein K6G33_04165 [Ruminococcus sp.]|uniref:hypothetical protein n=1 Tax=Ruminococcus sp. TaxID=41978 RepID=UPI0025E908E8|nr:hypothetical protein [Ruminococcus sp.]MCR5599923.1 hypothetical protein [Ruminococcus sp.]
MNKKNELVDNTEFEQELKDKMKELSSSVDCFGKISARAFPEKESFFSDSEFTVSDLENVTGKRRTPPFMKWAAVAAAAVICVCVLPKTAPFRDFLAQLGNNGDNEYSLLVSEILNETSKEGYTVCDIPLNRYIDYGLLVDPHYDCPFGQSDNTDAKVRLFVRTYNDIQTNQIYAIEYTGNFTDHSFLAAARSEATFSDKELEEIYKEIKMTEMSFKAEEAVKNAFTSDGTGVLVDKNDIRTGVASYEKQQIFKLGSEIMLLNTDVVYSCPIEGETYGYDISCGKLVNDSFVSVSIPSSEELWKCSLDYNDDSAFPKEKSTKFVRKNYFSLPKSADEYNTINCFKPFELAGEKLLDDTLQTFGDSENRYGMLLTPAFPDMKKSMRFYMSNMYFYYSSDSDPTVKFIIDGPQTNTSFYIHHSDLENSLYNG